ncbi:MAG: hypothetical protein P4L34_05185 [Paludibacter sp.]|nr:hypothetical protein [Paludibacter sp.]
MNNYIFRQRYICKHNNERDLGGLALLGSDWHKVALRAFFWTRKLEV